jgi:hypothetical protein
MPGSDEKCSRMVVLHINETQMDPSSFFNEPFFSIVLHNDLSKHCSSKIVILAGRCVI